MSSTLILSEATTSGSGRYSKICHLFSDISIRTFKNFYSASSSPLLLGGAPDYSTAKKNSFKTTIECVGRRPKEWVEGGSQSKQKNRPGVTKGRRPSIMWPAVSIVWLKNICWAVCFQKHLLVRLFS